LSILKAIIFDLDGTLVHQPPGIILQSNVKVVDYLDPDCLDPVSIVREVYAETTHNGGLLVTKAEQIRYMTDKLSIKVDEGMIHEGLKRFLENYLPACSLHSDTISTLEALAEKGIRMGIATNGAHDIQPRVIEKFGLGSFFDFVAISSEVKGSKDSKDFIRHLTDNCNIVPAETIVVGDTISDFMLGKGLSSEVYIVDRENEKPDDIPLDLLIPTLSVIPKIIEQRI
jgi:HAD superfamily hydrolase (TIGR01549 family)